MKTLLVISFSLLFSSIYAQQISHVSINSNGANLQSANKEISLTIGELVIEPLGNDSVSLGHGFVQGNITVDIIDIPNKDNDFNFTIYPNPTKDKVIIQCNSEDISNFKIELYDLAGKRILAKEYQNSKQHELSLNHLTNNIYILNVLNNKGSIFTSYKIYKTK